MTFNKHMPAIVIVGYNRIDSIKRLIGSVLSADVPNGVPLIISIDYSGDNEVENYVRKIMWPYGDIRIIAHSENLGLKKHILYCGDLTNEYGSIILLEDDLYVSKYFYNYATAALNFYERDEHVSGVSLYSFAFNINSDTPFKPLSCDDVYFLQQASSWGQAWSKSKWNKFRCWLEMTDFSMIESKLPNRIREWPESSWLKLFNGYNIVENCYFVYPIVSYSTNFGDAGTHFINDSDRYQVNLSMNKKDIAFVKFENSIAVYDIYMELLPEKIKKVCPVLQDYDFCVNLNNKKVIEFETSDYVLTTIFHDSFVLSFDGGMKPKEQALVFSLLGKGIYLLPRKNTPPIRFLDSFISYRSYYKMPSLQVICGAFLFYVTRVIRGLCKS